MVGNQQGLNFPHDRALFVPSFIPSFTRVTGGRSFFPDAAQDLNVDPVASMSGYGIWRLSSVVVKGNVPQDVSLAFERKDFRLLISCVWQHRFPSSDWNENIPGVGDSSFFWYCLDRFQSPSSNDKCVSQWFFELKTFFWSCTGNSLWIYCTKAEMYKFTAEEEAYKEGLPIINCTLA